MILADKIMTLRKKAGWSQEELAARLNVSRQSVSKWEGAQSIPDMDKVVQMSRLFGVTTDFLLKDELEIEEHTQSEPMDEPPLRRVTMEEASAYLALRRAAAPRMALATFLCIISPVALLMLAAMSEVSRFGISENAASGIGLCGLLVLVAIGVALFLTCSARVRDFAFLEEEPFETEYGVSGMVKERRKEIEDSRTRLNMIAEYHRHGAVHPVGGAALRLHVHRDRRRRLCGGGVPAADHRRCAVRRGDAGGEPDPALP